MILNKIIKRVREKVASQKAERPLEWYQQEQLEPQSPDCFKKALIQPGIQLIAEIKRASPTAGLICSEFEPVSIASEYQQAGAAAISVLTEEDFFQGSLEILQAVRQAVAVPLLRKDFIVDPYQIYQARYFGANCILLIVSILTSEQIKNYIQLAKALQMNALVEVHQEPELEQALVSGAEIIGINNRDLTTFKVDLNTSLRLRNLIPPDKIVVSESGIKTPEQVQQLEAAGIDAILVGESLMRCPDKTAAIKSLLRR